MANIIYSDAMYNESVKRAYLNLFKPGTQKILERLFKVSRQMEEVSSRDLHSFTRDELRRLFFLFMASTPSASRSNVTYVQNYIDWAIDQGFRKGLNPLHGIDTSWKEQFVVKPAKFLWTEDEINDMLDPNKLVNAQDRVMIALLFEGVKGKESSEITKLRRKDVDFDSGVLHLTDEDGSTRTVTVKEKTLEVIRKAIEEDDYIKKNGNPSDDIRSEKSDLIENDFVVRSANTHTKYFEDADKNIVYRRLKTIAEEFNEVNLTPTNVYYSGMVALARDLLKDRNKLGKEEFELIGARFNVSKTVISRLKHDFLNEDFVRDMYSIKS